jgi:cell division septation protein DedD
MAKKEHSHTDQVSQSDELFEEIFNLALSEERSEKKTEAPVAKTGTTTPRPSAKCPAQIIKPNDDPLGKGGPSLLLGQEVGQDKVPTKESRLKPMSKILIAIFLLAGAVAAGMFLLPPLNLPDIFFPGQKPSPVKVEMTPKPPPQTTAQAPLPAPMPEAEGASETTLPEGFISSVEVAEEIGMAAGIETTKEAEINEEMGEWDGGLKEAEARSYPYAIYLGSFRREDILQRALEIYREQGLSPYPVRMDLGPKGTWFRVFAGYFETREQTEAFIKKNHVADGESRNTRIAVLIGTYSSRQEAEAKLRALQEKGCHPYIIEESPFHLRIYTGAFYRDADVKTEAAWLASKGVTGKIVER